MKISDLVLFIILNPLNFASVNARVQTLKMLSKTELATVAGLGRLTRAVLRILPLSTDQTGYGSCLVKYQIFHHY